MVTASGACCITVLALLLLPYTHIHHALTVLLHPCTVYRPFMGCAPCRQQHHDELSGCLEAHAQQVRFDDSVREELQQLLQRWRQQAAALEGEQQAMSMQVRSKAAYPLLEGQHICHASAQDTQSKAS
jgi:hypothetical protein